MTLVSGRRVSDGSGCLQLLSALCAGRADVDLAEAVTDYVSRLCGPPARQELTFGALRGSS